MRGEGFTAAKAWWVLAGFWTAGVVMLVGSSYGSVGLNHFRHARVCSATEAFTPTNCRITLDATVTALTREHLVMDVHGRQVSVETNFHGPLPDTVAGLPVRVTFYQGVAVHIEGGDLNFDTALAPVSHVDELRGAGLLFLIAGTLIVGVNPLIRFARRSNFA